MIIHPLDFVATDTGRPQPVHPGCAAYFRRVRRRTLGSQPNREILDANLVRTHVDIANDIRSLSDFKRNTSELLDRLKKSGNPLVLTINGKAEIVVQDAEAYQELLERLETLEGIQRGLVDVKAGRTKPAREVFNRLRRKHGIPR
jgi:prevent-host-death family protein